MEASNVRAMYDALVKVKRLFDGLIMFQPSIRKAHKAVNAALAAPPRNCDVGTAEEQSERYEKFCYAHRSREKGCGGCPLCDIVCCGFAWLQMPYESEVKE